MKKSDKLIMVVGMIPVLIVLIIFLYLKSIHDDVQNAKSLQEKSGSQVTKLVDLEGVSMISADGNWKIHIVQGKSSKAEMKIPENMQDKINFNKSGSMFRLGENRKILGTINDEHLEATIITPVIETIYLRGTNFLDLSNINNESFSIDMQGVTTVSGSKSTIQNLSIIGSGVSKMNLSGVSVTNASIEYYGSYNINLAMNGGKLSGRLGGVGILNYDGNISVNEVKIDSQLGKVDQ